MTSGHPEPHSVILQARVFPSWNFVPFVVIAFASFTITAPALKKCYIHEFMSAPNSSFVRACKSQPVDRTPVWFMRQAGRYMPEYRAVRKQHSLLEICKKPALAAEVTITAAEFLGVDAAIIFADLLLPLEVMGLPFHFSAGEGPVIEKPVRSTRRHRRPAHRPRRRTRLCFRSGGAGREAFRRPRPRHRILRRSLHPRQLHDRRRRLAQLRPRQEDDVQLSRRLGRADAQAGCGDHCLFRRAGARRRRRHPDFRQLGRMPERGRLSPLRPSPRHRHGEAVAENRSAHHLFRHRQRHACCPP